ncbi:PIG-P, partial [Chytridium lagenaria]
MMNHNHSHRILLSYKKRQYYGFVLYLSTFISFVVYLVWAICPDDVLESFGITYYPKRYWALAIPIWVIGCIPFTLITFSAYNLLQTPPLSSLVTITDKNAHVMQKNPFLASTSGFPPLEDVPISLVNQV